MEYRYFYKEPGKQPELRLCKGEEIEPISKRLKLHGDMCVGHASVSSQLMAYFDDNGIIDKDKGLVEYNCNLPSSNPKFQNQICGILIIEKYIGEDAVDMDEDIFKILCDAIFEVPKEQWYTTKDVMRIWKSWGLDTE